MNARPIRAKQDRNQLGTPGVAKSFLRGAEIFLTLSNIFKLCPIDFSRVGEKIFRRGRPHRATLVTVLGQSRDHEAPDTLSAVRSCSLPLPAEACCETC